MIGKVIGPYQVLEKIGADAYGVIYCALEQGRGRAVALRALSSLVSRPPEALTRLRNLAAHLPAIKHPHLVGFYTLLQAGPELYVVTEAVAGWTLAETLRMAGVLPCEHAAVLMSQTLAALSHAQQSGLAHGALNPAGVYLTSAGEVQVANLGLAFARGPQAEAQGLSVRELTYLAPEQVRGEGFDARSDVYAVGAMLYELVTGLPPLRRAHEAALRQAIAQEAPPSPRSYFPLIPTALEEFLLRALAKDPAARFQSAAEMRVALQVCLTPPAVAAAPVRITNPSIELDLELLATLRAPTRRALPAVPAEAMAAPVQAVADAAPEPAAATALSSPAVVYSALLPPALPEYPVTPSPWPQLAEQPAPRPAARRHTPVESLFGETVVALEESEAAPRPRWKFAAATAGLLALIGAPLALWQMNDRLPTITTNAAVRPAPTVAATSAPTPPAGVTSPVPQATGEFAKPRPGSLTPNGIVPPLASPSPEASPKTAQGRVTPVPAGKPVNAPGKSPAPLLTKSPKPVTVPVAKGGKMAPPPTPLVVSKNGKPKAAPTPTLVVEKKKGGVGGLLKGIFGRDKKAKDKAKKQ